MADVQVKNQNNITESTHFVTHLKDVLILVIDCVRFLADLSKFQLYHEWGNMNSYILPFGERNTGVRCDERRL